MKVWKLRQSWTMAACAVALAAAPCLAAWVSAKVSTHVDGVDATGNPSASNGATISTKSYKETVSGVIVQFSAAWVKNESGAAQTYNNRGLSIVDPATATNTTPTTVNATNDVEYISRPVWKQTAGAVDIRVYVPPSNPPSA